MLFLHFGKEKHGATGKAVPEDEEAHRRSARVIACFVTSSQAPQFRKPQKAQTTEGGPMR